MSNVSYMASIRHGQIGVFGVVPGRPHYPGSDHGQRRRAFGQPLDQESTPLDPGLEEYKYYAPGIGLILEVGPDDDRLELVELSR